MAEILSLSKVRKARARAEKEANAAQNRVRFGRTKAEKQIESATRALEAKKVDDHKRDE